MTPFETFAAGFLDVCIQIALLLICLTFLLTVVRTVLGPTLPDRVLALDMLVGTVIGFIAIIGIVTDYYLYIDIAITLGLVGFLATVALARFILNRGTAGDPSITEEVKEGLARNRRMK
ncbi:sodium:proton antiporter [Microvirga tunisiensis]|uniref:Sodium:proton antiporter n=1 Tax=Pannonibacter tanglangensis TaxID=2750084 RepID=A0A7X5F2C5_9HYPH|nr:sodium:proton antiporter [Pannonibacter sp. XCT-53]